MQRPSRWLGLLALLALLLGTLSPLPAQKDRGDKSDQEKQPALTERDLALVAAAGCGYLVLSPNDILDHPLLKQAPPRLRENLQRIEREMPARMGVRLRQLQRFTVAFPVGDMTAPVGLLSGPKEFDVEAIRKNLGADWTSSTPKKLEGTLWTSAHGSDALLLHSPALLLIGRPQDMESFLERARLNRTDATLRRGLVAAGSGAQVVLGVRPDDLLALEMSAGRITMVPTPRAEKAPIPQDKSIEKKRSGPGPALPPGGARLATAFPPADVPDPERPPLPTMADLLRELPPQALPYKPLLLCKSATLAVRLGEETAALSLRLGYGKPDQVEDGVVALKTTLYVLREMLPHLWLETVGMRKESAIEVVRALDRLLEAMKKTTVQGDGRAVEATMTLPLEEATVGVLLRELSFELPLLAERTNNLKQIGLAILNYHDTYGAFPGTAYYSAGGKPLLSWRVAILPYIEESNLYNQFKLDEPWDSPTNIKLLAKMPKVFAPPPGVKAEAGHTFLQAFSGARCVFDPSRDRKQGKACLGIRIVEITDGTSNTATVGESARAVPWTKPDDMRCTGQAVPPLGCIPGSDRCLVLMADGSVHTITTRPPLAAFRDIVGRDEGNIFDIDDLKPGKVRPEAPGSTPRR